MFAFLIWNRFSRSEREQRWKRRRYWTFTSSLTCLLVSELPEIRTKIPLCSHWLTHSTANRAKESVLWAAASCLQTQGGLKLFGCELPVTSGSTLEMGTSLCFGWSLLLSVHVLFLMSVWPMELFSSPLNSQSASLILYGSWEETRRAVWKSSTKGPGGQYVMITGPGMRPPWSAECWDSTEPSLPSQQP